MKHTTVMKLFIGMMVATSLTSAQPFQPPDPQGRPGPERLQRFKKMRLIEVLKLNEDEAVRFFAKQSAHEDKIHELIKSRNDALDAIESKVRDKADTKEIQKLSTQAMDIDQQVFNERKRFQDEIRNFLTPEKFGKFLVFERNFEHHMREAMEDMMRERKHRERDE